MIVPDAFCLQLCLFGLSWYVQAMSGLVGPGTRAWWPGFGL